jgi:hypothetical protein
MLPPPRELQAVPPQFPPHWNASRSREREAGICQAPPPGDDAIPPEILAMCQRLAEERDEPRNLCLKQIMEELAVHRRGLSDLGDWLGTLAQYVEDHHRWSTPE